MSRSRTKKKVVHVEVTLDECRGDPTRMIKKFMKKVKKERVVEDHLDHLRYTKPSLIDKERRRIRAKLSRITCPRCGRHGHKKKECRYSLQER